MLPPSHLRSSLTLAKTHTLTSHALRAGGSMLLRTSLATSQPRRSFWGWRRSSDWTSHLDPLYHRFCRVRTLKTRAKLLRNLKRRGKFEWDNNAADFFTPKHVRWATRWDGFGGRGGGRWGKPHWSLYRDPNDPENRKDVDEGIGKDQDGDAPHELSHREKIWKEQMEAMRKRIESDPYEAIFGKRFEPFWSPLVPSWMREEMGLPVWKEKEGQRWVKMQSAKAADVETPIPRKDEPKKDVPKKKEETAAKPAVQAETVKATDVRARVAKKSEGKATPTKLEPEAQKPASYSYASSTSWDSRSNKTRRVEWDSVSGQTKKYEYDPISNRMVLAEAPKKAEPKSVETTPESANKSTEHGGISVGKTVSPQKDTTPSSQDSIPKVTSNSKAVDIPVKQSSDLRKSIPIPPPLSQPSHSIPIGFTPAPTSVEKLTVKNMALTGDAPKTTAATASDEVEPTSFPKYMSGGKSVALGKTGIAEQYLQIVPESLESLTANDVRANMGRTRQPADKSNSVQTQVDALLSENSTLPLRSKIAASLDKTSEWDKAEMNVLYDKELDSLHRKKEKLLKDERGLFHIERQKRELIKLDERIKELVERVEKMNESFSSPSGTSIKAASTSGLQSSLERMQSMKDLPTRSTAADETDADDAAAHESTESIESAYLGVPKNWGQQADLLQADRVKRTTMAKRIMSPYTPDTIRSLDASNARKATHAAQRVQDEAKAAEELAKIAQEKQRLEREKKLEKANAMLESEVKEQKFKMQAHENRYAHKIRSLRNELEVAYKQSAVHGEKHVEHIKFLEQELAKAQKATGDKDVKTGIEGSQAEGDLSNGVTNWYQQQQASTAQQVKAQVKEREEQKRRDQELVKEIREVYESRYGEINASHKQPRIYGPARARALAKQERKARKSGAQQPQVVEVESDVDLGDALADYEKEFPYRFVEDGLEKELQAREREANEGVKLVDDKVPKLIPTGLAKTASSEEESAPAPPPLVSNIQWAEPPLYKVLAYDSGNDLMSAATTTSNFAGTETPISLTEALSELYQPARFVSHFAELQQEGYQVIYGTKDLLVFRKVQPPLTTIQAPKIGPAFEDHGLVAGRNHPDHWSAWPLESASSTDVNPIDGTVKAEPRIGNFASPTAFLKHDPVDPSLKTLSFAEVKQEIEAKNQSSTNKFKSDVDNIISKSQEEYEEDIDYRHYPRVKREEYPVFTGTRRKWREQRKLKDANNKTTEPNEQPPPNEQVEQSTPKSKRQQKREEKGKRHRRRAAWKRALGVGLGAAGVMYVVGYAAERSRERKAEDWARKAEEARRAAATRSSSWW